MSGWVGPNRSDIFLSRTTLASFEDLGFEVNYIPEPATSLLLLGAACLARRRR